MKRILYILFLLFIFNTAFTQYSNKVITTEEKEVARFVIRFVELSKKRRYKKAYELTTGKTREFYKKILDKIKRNHGVTPKEFKQFFARLRSEEVDFVALGKNGKKAVAVCVFQFRYFDSLSRDEIRKDREVLYYLVKINDKWKITHSKLDKEKVYYWNRKHKKWRLRY